VSSPNLLCRWCESPHAHLPCHGYAIAPIIFSARPETDPSSKMASLVAENTPPPRLRVNSPRPHQPPLRRPPTASARTLPFASSLPSPGRRKPALGPRTTPLRLPPTSGRTARRSGGSSGSFRRSARGSSDRRRFDSPVGGRACQPGDRTPHLRAYGGRRTTSVVRRSWVGCPVNARLPRPGAQDPAYP
jgi:hypothetical protein